MARYPEDLDRWRQAGQISARARSVGVRALRPGRSRREVAEVIEASIRGDGALPAFPANLSRNFEAAHYTPSPSDDFAFEAGDLVKVDVGAHLDGAISDTAETVEVGGTHQYENLIRSTQDAVRAGIAHVRAGVAIDEISRAIESAIHARGFKPVSNLTGHTIQRYLLHAGKSIPNVGGATGETLEEGEIVAIEPFATNGAGSIENGSFGHIVRFRRDPGAGEPELSALFQRFRTLPFTARWVTEAAQRTALAQGRRFLQTYPVFVESGGGWVSQAEHTVVVGPNSAEVLTELRP